MSTKAERDRALMKGGQTTLTLVKATEIVKEIDAHVVKCAALKDVAVAKQVNPEQFAMFAAMAEAIDFCNGVMSLVRMDLEAFIGSGGTTGFMGEQVVKETTVVEKLAGVRDEFAERVCKAVAGVFAEDVVAHKAGRKMAAARLTKLKEAAKAITDLVSELDLEPIEKEVHVSTKPAESTAPGAPSATAPTTTPVAAVTAPAATAPAPEGMEAVVAKAIGDVLPKAIETTVNAAVEKSVGAAVEAAVTKATAGLTERLGKLEAAPAKPAAEAANGTEGDGAPETETQKAAGKSFWRGVI